MTTKQEPMKPVPPVPSVGDHAQGHKPMKLIIGFNQVLNRKLREVMYSVINDFIEKDDVKALCLENVTFVAEIGDTKQLTVHWNKDQAIIASAPDVGIYEGPDWPLYELDSVIEESKAGVPFDETSLRTLIRVHQAMSKALDTSKGG